MRPPIPIGGKRRASAASARTGKPKRARRAREARQQAEQQRRQQVVANNTQNWAAWIDQRIAEGIQADREALHKALGQIIAEQRRARQKEIAAAVDEVQRTFETKIAALEERLRAVPGQLPVAKAWRPESVIYRGEFICYEGSTFQAKRGTAQRPGGDDWLCVAPAGRDAVTPRIRGTYSTDQEYRLLDICALDGAAFVARKDNPGICPGNGWQLLCRQGKSGRRGDKGDLGPRGEKGEPGPAVMPKIVSQKIEGYNLVVLREDKSLEIFDLRPMFERYHNEAQGG